MAGTALLIRAKSSTFVICLRGVIFVVVVTVSRGVSAVEGFWVAVENSRTALRYSATFCGLTRLRYS